MEFQKFSAGDTVVWDWESAKVATLGRSCSNYAILLITNYTPKDQCEINTNLNSKHNNHPTNPTHPTLQ